MASAQTTNEETAMNSINDTSSKSRFGFVGARAGLATLAIAGGVVMLAVPAWSGDLSVITTGRALSSADASVVTKVVSFADLNLNSEPGAKTLHGRLRNASNKVCAGLEAQRPIQQAYKWRSCVDGALARAVEQIDSPTLTSYHLAWIGKNETAAMVARDTR
jgi:UrcA family protein